VPELPEEQAGAPFRSRRSAALPARVWGYLVDGLAALGTVMIGGLMVIICADIVARNVLGRSLPLISELSALTLVMIVYLQLATTIRHNRLVRADILISGIGIRFPRLRVVLETVFDILGAIVIAILAWSTIGILERDYRATEFIGVTGVLTIPTWPFRALILVGVTVAAVQFVIQVLERLPRLATRYDAGP
jgi:TRAP-type mannitol/chloroaromatic compound transport system permease small subunit